MEKNIEKEFKILLNEEKFFKLVDLEEPNNFVLQKNTYFDTKDQKLKAKRIAMRIREKENKFIFTLKRPNQFNSLDEFECFCNGCSINEIKSNIQIQQLLNKLNINHDDLTTTTNIKTYRAKKITELAELCFDINIYNSNIDFELEYEYKKEHDGEFIFNNILKQVNMKYKKNCASKIKRALDCIDNNNNINYN